jgi:hypothetical protein
MGTRPYFVTYQGLRRLVEASSPAVAAQIVVGDDIAELRPARASEVSAWYRAQYPVDVAGKPLSPGFRVGDDAEAVFTADDARNWLIEKLGGGLPGDRVAFDADGPAAGAILRFSAVEQMGVLSAEDFESIAAQCPEFSVAVGLHCSGEGKTPGEIAAELAGGEGIDFQDVVTAIGEAKRRDLFEDNDASARNELAAAQR